jgi:hypothetical protein
MSQMLDKVSELIALGESYGLMPIHEGRKDNKLQVRYNSRLYTVISSRGSKMWVKSYYFRDTATDAISHETLLEYLAFYESKIKATA